jgi:hypothetical protein
MTASEWAGWQVSPITNYLDQVGGSAVVEAVRVDVVLPPEEVEVRPQRLLAHAVGVEVQLILVKILEMLCSGSSVSAIDIAGISKNMGERERERGVRVP